MVKRNVTLKAGGGVNAQSFMSLLFMSLSLRGGGVSGEKDKALLFVVYFFLMASLIQTDSLTHLLS